MSWAASMQLDALPQLRVRAAFAPQPGGSPRRGRRPGRPGTALSRIVARRASVAPCWVRHRSCERGTGFVSRNIGIACQPAFDGATKIAPPELTLRRGDRERVATTPLSCWLTPEGDGDWSPPLAVEVALQFGRVEFDLGPALGHLDLADHRMALVTSRRKFSSPQFLWVWPPVKPKLRPPSGARTSRPRPPCGPGASWRRGCRGCRPAGWP